MSNRPISWYTMKPGEEDKQNSEYKKPTKKMKKKPPDLNLLESSDILLERRRHSIHTPEHFSPPLHSSRETMFPLPSPNMHSRSIPHFSYRLPGLSSSPSPLIDITESHSPRDTHSPDSAIFLSPRIHLRENHNNSPGVDYSPPDSPNAIITARTLNRGGWHQQPRKRSLTPIPERLNSVQSTIANGHHSDESSRTVSPSDVMTSMAPDFLREISTADFHQDDIKVIVGSNKIRIIGERQAIKVTDVSSSGGSHNKKKQDKQSQKQEHQEQELHKVVDIPKHIDPSSIKVKKSDHKITIHGFLNPNKKGWSKKHSGFLAVPNPNNPNNDLVTIQVKVPSGLDPKKLRFKAVTKHYLVISGSNNPDDNTDEGIGSASKERTQHHDSSNSVSEEYLETFELPCEPDKFHISSRMTGKNTMLVEVPLSFRSRSSSM